MKQTYMSSKVDDIGQAKVCNEVRIKQTDMSSEVDDIGPAM